MRSSGGASSQMSIRAVRAQGGDPPPPPRERAEMGACSRRETALWRRVTPAARSLPACGRGERSRYVEAAAQAISPVAVGGGEADVFEQRGRHRGHLLAVGGAGDRDAGLVEDGLGAGAWALRLLSSSAISTLYWPLRIVGDLARRGRGQDQRVVGRVDRREAMGEGAEAALIGVAPGGVDARRAWRTRPAPSSRPARIRC